VSQLHNPQVNGGGQLPRRFLFIERLPQRGKGKAKGLAGDDAKPAHQSLLIERPELIQKDQAMLTPEHHRDAKGRWATPGGHRGNRDRAEMIVHLGRRHDQTRPGLLDLAAERWVERCQPDLAAAYGSDLCRR
jgi:hypothetical protein